MGAETKIEWAHRTWSPWRGCTKVSPGCANCYAEALSHRNPKVLGEWGPDGHRAPSPKSAYDRLKSWDRAARKAGERHRVFPSLCDPFEGREDLVGRLAYFLQFFTTETPNLDLLLLTKRPQNWRPLMERIVETCWGPQIGVPPEFAVRWLDGEPPRNVWLGTSVEDQQRADERIPALLGIPAVVRFLSVEPLLGPIDFTAIDYGDQRGLNALTGEFRYYREHDGEPCSDWEPRIDWVIIGGESGHHARPCDLAWVRWIWDQCQAAGTACFVKQDMGQRSGMQGRIPDDLWAVKEFPR